MATASEIHAALIYAGFSPQTAANLLAVWGYRTSGTYGTGAYTSNSVNGGALNPGGPYGLAQWVGNRLTGLLNFAAANGMSPDSVDAQAGHAYNEFLAMGLDPQNASISESARQFSNK
jgi:hypothetical protein